MDPTSREQRSGPTVLLDARVIDCAGFYGVARHAREMARRLPELRPEWNWVTLLHGPKAERRDGSVHTIVRPIPVDCYGAEQAAFEELGATLKPDLVHSFWYSAGEAFDCQRLLTVYDVIAFMPFDDVWTAERLSALAWYRRSCQAADHVAVPSLATYRDVCRQLAKSPARVSIIPLGVSDAFRPASPAEVRDARQRWHLPERYVFCSAHYPAVAYKGLALVQLAREALVSRGSAPPVLVSAGGPSVPLPPGWLGLPHLPDEELSRVVSGALALIYPSLAEGFGLPPLEAMACGVPVLCSNAGSLPEVCGEAALYFDPRSPEALGAAWSTLLESPLLADELKSRGSRRAALFTWDLCARRTLALYERLLSTEERLPSIEERLPSTEWCGPSGPLAPPRARVPVRWREACCPACLPPPVNRPAEEGQLRALAGYLVARGRDPERALDVLLREDAAFPDRPLTLKAIGTLLVQLQRLEEARAYLSRFLDSALGSRDPQLIQSASYHLGVCELHRGQYAEAIRHLETCIETCPDHQAAPPLLEKARSLAASLE